MSAFFSHLLQPKKTVKRRRSRVFNSPNIFGLDYIVPNSEEEIALHPKKLNEVIIYFFNLYFYKFN